MHFHASAFISALVLIALALIAAPVTAATIPLNRTSAISARSLLPLNGTSVISARSLLPLNRTSSAISARSLLPLNGTSVISARSLLPLNRTSSAISARSFEYSALGCPPSTSEAATTTTQREAVQDFANLLYRDNNVTGAFGKYVARDLIQHGTDVPGDGAEVAMKTVAPLLAASTVDVKFISVGQDISTTFLEGKMKGGNESVAAVDMFRMSGTCLIEHWVIQVAVVKSENPRAPF